MVEFLILGGPILSFSKPVKEGRNILFSLMFIGKCWVNAIIAIDTPKNCSNNFITSGCLDEAC